jgi:hypothetical protein
MPLIFNVWFHTLTYLCQFCFNLYLLSLSMCFIFSAKYKRELLHYKTLKSLSNAQ